MELHGKNVLKILDFTTEEVEYLLELSASLKRDKTLGNEKQKLNGKNVALIFQKDSTRTRCSFEVACYDQGAKVTYMGPSGSHFGTKESVADTARFLSSIYDGIEYRGDEHEVIEELAKYSSVPVWNGLTDEWHPTQMLADYLTIYEQLGKIAGINFCYLGDARNNVANSYIIMAAKMGVNIKIGAPQELWPEQKVIEAVKQINLKTGGSLHITEDPIEAITNANVVTTDVWVSMGEAEEVWETRIKQLIPYQVNSKLVAHADSNYIFMHCLPACHDLKTKLSKQIFEKFNVGESGLEVTDEIFESSNSVVFKQAENRMHTIKAVMVATIGE